MARRGEVPAVDIIVPEILDIGERRLNGAEIRDVAGKRGALQD